MYESCDVKCYVQSYIINISYIIYMIYIYRIIYKYKNFIITMYKFDAMIYP